MDIVKFGKTAVYLNIFGILFSGLIFPVASMLLTPMPPWKDAALFVASWHPLQTATFFCGYFLITGSVMTFIALYLLSQATKKVWALTGLMIHCIFAGIVFLNYIIQTTYIPFLAMNNPPETIFILPVLTMANPGSLAWAFEMYGWGGIGLSYIFMAWIFKDIPKTKLLRFLFVLNGVSSISSALLTSYDMNWLFSSSGLSALVIWNTLVLVIDILLLIYFRKIQPEVFWKNP